MKDNAKIWAVTIITCVVSMIAGTLIITGHSITDLLAFAAIVVIPVITYFTTDARASINQVKEMTRMLLHVPLHEHRVCIITIFNARLHTYLIGARLNST